ncbi:hypothetical protein [Gemmatimonas sp.]|uniref:hypothetical protein n=1 Tax=Gemmatimonas sp. TaxID=1962908 RepID=UPI00286DC049|nr:hypothetical protein [Gemmatimonas sp.]
MRTLLVVSLLAFAIPNAAVVRAQGSGSVTSHDHSMSMPQGGAMTALLTDPFGSRGASGTATVRGTSVLMQWSGDQPGTARVWSVRRGSCARDEGLIGAASAYAPIAVDAAGSARAGASLDAPLAADGQFHVLVQTAADSPSAGAAATRIACGALAKGATPARAVTELTTSSNGSRPAAMDHSAMDHSSMNMSGSGAASGAADAATPSTSMSGMGATDTSLMAIHMRMMADPVIRERVMTDPVLQRMMAQMPGMSAMDLDMDMPGMKRAPSGSGAAARAKATGTTAEPAARPAVKPATRAATRPAAKPAAKPASKPAPAAMPGMDHSKMPGMRKPPA